MRRRQGTRPPIPKQDMADEGPEENPPSFSHRTTEKICGRDNDVWYYTPKAVVVSALIELPSSNRYTMIGAFARES